MYQVTAHAPTGLRIMRPALGVLAFLLIAACGESDRQAAGLSGPAPAPQILDGAREGNPHFFFLPPLVPQPSFSGTSDANASPLVVICEWDAANDACTRVMAQFARANREPDEGEEDDDVIEGIRYNKRKGRFHFKWDTEECSFGPCQLDPAKTYRIRVLVGSTELGHADVDVVANKKELKNVETDEFIGLVEGKKLPIKFRIETGAVAVVAPGAPAVVGSTGGEVTTNDGEVSLHFPPGALPGATSITVSPITDTRPQTGPWSDPVELGPDGTQFAQPVTLTLSYDVRQLPPGVPPEALRLSTWVVDHWEEVPGSTLHVDDATISAPITHFSGYALAIWPNAARTPTGATQLYVGQGTTFSGSTYYYDTVPYQGCWTYRVWVGSSFSGYWSYQTQCYTYTHTYSYPVSGYVSWASTNPGVVSVGPPGWSLANNGFTTSPAMTAVAPGSSDIIGSFGSVRSTVTVTVLPQLVFDVFGTGLSPVRTFGFNQGTGLNVRLPAPLASDLAVSLAHSNTAVGTSNPGLVIPAGATQHGVTIRARTEAGADTLVGTAPGFGPDTLIILTGPGRVTVAGWPSSLAHGDSARIRIHPMNPDSSIIDNAWFTSFALGSNGLLAFSRNDAPITSIPVPDGTSSTPDFYVKAIGTGAATMTVSNPQYVTGPYAVNVLPPPFTSISVQPDPAGVKPGQTVQLTGAALDASHLPVAGVVLAWTSSNTAIATVDANGLVTGIANGNVTITASNGGVAGSATVKVGTPSIAPSPGSLTIQVQQGQVNQAQIAINNGGTGLLTGLQAGTFSNYFNGSPAPWVTATFNTTTAPSILTITAAPGTNIGPGVHQLRFDVWGDGVPAYTFYSINITVVAAGVTPVNATIAPSPGSLAFTVAQGESASRQITIGNTGTDPLTNITAGSFSNYFNGAPAPWVTASVSPTTAPATVTVTAAPDLTVGLGTHQLRFDVASPGATNSPYTFYSINVTVTAPVVPPWLAGGGKSTCALRTDRTAVCWGETSFGATAASSGTFATIGGGFFHYCGIRPDQSLNCWGYNSDNRATPPTTGTYDRLSVGPEHNCALRTDNTAACWGFGGDGRASPPAGTYKQIGVGWYHGCGVRSDDTVACWGQNGQGQSTAPAGTFKSVSGGASFTCGIRTDDALQCWGTIASPPAGAFTQVASASAGAHACAIRQDRTIACWGENTFGQANAPAGQYLQVVTNYQQSCAVRSDRVVVCWGSGATGATSVPAELQNP